MKSSSSGERVTLAVARLTHGHVSWVFEPGNQRDIELVGIYEPDREVADRYTRKFGFDRGLLYTDLNKMLDATRPRVIAAFGSIAEHVAVVETAASRGIHVMVEKPLAFSLEESRAELKIWPNSTASTC